MKRTLIYSLVAGAIVAIAAAGPVAAGVSDKDIENDAKNPTSVLSWGIGTQGQRYSPLTKINVKTIKDLVPAWTFSFGGEKQRGQEAQPLVYNGKLFVTGSYSRLFALDARTGKKLWQ